MPGSDHGSTRSASVRFEGRTRTYRLYVPPRLHEPVPLVILLHGAGGDGRSMESGTGFDAEAERHVFLAAYPDGVDHYWNAGFCCPRPNPVASDDVGFTGALIDDIGSRWRLDQARVYVAGFSNGGYMAYRLACQMAGRLAAIAAAGADSQECPPNAPSQPVSILQVHGTADDRNRGREQVQRDGSWLETATTAADQWRQVDGCPASPRKDTSGKVAHSQWDACRQGTEVSFYEISGGTHTWPRQSPDATRLAADFFATHHRS